MTAYYIPPEFSCSTQLPADFQVVFMSPSGPTANSGDVNMPYINTGFADGRQEDQFQTQYFSPDNSTVQQQQFFVTAPRTTIPFFQDGYSQGMMTMVTPRNVCHSSSRLPTTPQFTMHPNPQFFPHQVRFTTNPYEPAPETQHESLLCRGKRQRDESYRYSLGCINRRVQSWLEKSKPFARAAQNNLEDQLVQDALMFDRSDENFYELFDEPRRKRFCPSLPADGNHVSISATPNSESPMATGVAATTPAAGVMSNPLLFPQSLSDTFSAASPRGMMGSVSMSEDLHGSCLTEQEFIVKFPKQIPAICPVIGTKVHFDELTDRSVLRNWRCRTDDADLIHKKGRKRFFKRVAVLPPDSWQPNKRPQTWEWAPSGPFALHLGEFVSISGTNGYPYEIVLIRHIPPALRCFLSLVPVPREMAIQMLNGEKIAPEFSFVVHIPVDSVTHKWILNGIRPRDYTLEMALDYINKDIEMERVQKEQRKARKNSVLSGSESALLDSGLLSLDSLVTASSEDDLVKSPRSSDSVVGGCAPPVKID